MCNIDRLAEHEGATSNDNLEAQFFTLTNRLLRNTTAAKRSMKPNSTYPVVAALPYHLNGDIRIGSDHNAIDGRRQGGDIRIAGDALDFRGPGIDGKNVVARVSQPSEYGIGRLVLVSGNPCHRDAFAAKEVGDRLRNPGHR